MEHQAFYEGLFLTMERSGQDFRTEQEKLEEEFAMNYRIRLQRDNGKERYSSTPETDAAIMDIARIAEQRHGYGADTDAYIKAAARENAQLVMKEISRQHSDER